MQQQTESTIAETYVSSPLPKHTQRPNEHSSSMLLMMQAKPENFVHYEKRISKLFQDKRLCE